jgi:hypothetical protein
MYLLGLSEQKNYKHLEYLQAMMVMCYFPVALHNLGR